jgi:protein SFI1
MSNPFIPARSSTPPSSLAQRSAVSDVSRSSALSTAELATLTPDDIEFLDTVISRAPTSATTFIHIFKAYNEVINERGLDPENEVDYYKKLLKIGTLKGENWASKWRAVKTQNGYTATPTPAKARLPLHKATPQAHLPSSTVASVTPLAQPSTARLLKRLKALQHEQPPEPPESVPDDLLSRTDITDTETDSPPRAAPVPTPGRPSSGLTTTDNTLGLDVGAIPRYPPSSTLAPSKPAGSRWFERDPDIDKSVPFLTSTPPLSPHKPASRATPVSTRQPVIPRVPMISTPFKSLADLRTPNSREDDAWSKVRVEQDERSADQFRNTGLLQRCFDVWKQGYDWVIVSLLPARPLRPRGTASLNSNHPSLPSFPCTTGNDSSNLPCARYVRSSCRHSQVALCSGTATRANSAGRRPRRCILPEGGVHPLARTLAGETEGRVACRYAHAHADGSKSARWCAAQGCVGALASVVPEPSHATALRRAPR